MITISTMHCFSADDVDPDLQLAIERSMMEMADASHSRRESICSSDAVSASIDRHEASAAASRATTTVVDPYVLSSYFKKVVDKEYSIANENLCSSGADDDDMCEATALAKAEAEASNKVHKILLKSISGGGSTAHSDSESRHGGEVSIGSAISIGHEDDQDETELAIDAGNEELDAIEIAYSDNDGEVGDQNRESGDAASRT